MNLLSSRMRLRDVLVLRVGGTAEERADVEQLAENLTGLVRIPIIILTEDMSLESLSTAQMAQAGWVRADSRIASMVQQGGETR